LVNGCSLIYTSVAGTLTYQEIQALEAVIQEGISAETT
jgi:hypothetical protein